MNILALDPGKVTGVAAYDTTLDVFASWEVAGRHRLHDTLTLDSRKFDSYYDEVVCEDFVISQRTIKTTPQKDPLRIIGWLDLTLYHDDVPFTLQTAAAAKSFATDAKLKHVGWFTKEGEGHANDAARHLLVYLVAKYPQQAMKLLEGLDLS